MGAARAGVCIRTTLFGRTTSQTAPLSGRNDLGGWARLAVTVGGGGGVAASRLAEAV